MTWLFVEGHAVDIVLLVLAIELGWLVRKGGWRVSDAFLRLAPGAFMLLALRAALTGQDWRWIALPLILSFPVHLIDLARSTSRLSKGDKMARRSLP
jgi:multisubunit Na+/H+ antiporter MnhE subunit